MTPRPVFVAVLGVALLTLTPLGRAQQPGVRAESGGVAIGGSVSGSTITVGVTEEMRAALVRPYEELSETQKR